MRSIEISKKSTAFIPARQTDKSCWKTLPCHRLKYRWNRQLSFVRDRPTSLAEILYHVFVVWNIDEIDSFHSCETDRHFWICMGAHRIRWKTLPYHRLKYRWNRQLSFLRDRPTSLAEILHHVSVVWNIDEIDSFHSCETDRQVWISMGAYWISWNMSSFRTLTYTQTVNWSSASKLIKKNRLANTVTPLLCWR
jgi:hypothetical protein